MQRGDVSLVAVAVPGHDWRGSKESVWNTSESGKSGAVGTQNTPGMWSRCSAKEGAAVVIYRTLTRGGKLRHYSLLCSATLPHGGELHCVLLHGQGLPMWEAHQT